MRSTDTIKTTCPRDCYDACGIAVVKRDGGIVKVLGDPAHAVSRGALCGKCAIAYNGVWRDPVMRLTRPLRRVGPKGQRTFTAISWEEALATIASELDEIIGADHAATILHTHYTGTVGLLAGWFPLRFFNHIGATEVDPDTVCNKAGHAALELVFGNSLEGFDPRIARDARTIVVWGANPSHCAPHQNKGWLARARANGTRVIVVDPFAHETARAADLHLQVAPGMDAVLAFAMLRVLLDRGLLDRDFIARCIEGASELLPIIEAVSLQQASEQCGLDAAAIEDAAVSYGRGPSLLWLGQGLQRQPQGGNIFRSIAALAAMSGNLCKPGAGLLYMNGPAMRGVDMSRLTRPAPAHRAVPPISHMDLATALESAQTVRAFINWNNNPAASSPEQRRLRRALQREDLFHVAIDLFHTDTTAYADIVLPASSFLEFDDLVLSYFDLTISAQVRAAEPMGESLPNTEIFRRLAATMGLSEPELFETDESMLADLLRQTSFPGDFAALGALGTADLFDAPRVQFPSGRFPTASGKIELASQRAVDMGLPRTPLPLADAPTRAGMFRLLSPASPWSMNSSYANDALIRARLGHATVELHCDDAQRLHVIAGDQVLLTNANGELPLQVVVSRRARPGVALVYKGRWPSLEAADANVNVLIAGRKSDIGESTTVHGTEVQISVLRRAT